MNPPNSQRIQTAPYMDRILPWGETCRVAESRIKKSGWREAWLQRGVSLRRANPTMDMHESAYQAMTEFPPLMCDLEGEEVSALSEDDDRFVMKCREGLQMDLPLRAGVERELDWIGGNLNRALPNLAACPSLWSINFIMDARVNKRVRENFWATCWSKRLSPGDSRKRAKSVVVEDQTDVEGEAHDDDLEKRLRGD